MNLLGNGQNPEFWSKTVRNGECYKTFIKERLEIWENYCVDKPIVELKYSSFKLFKVNGNRNIYEDVYFKRRKNMDTAALLALIYPEEDKYINYLMDVLFAVLNEYTWCLPAHNTALERNNNVNIDLFAAETGFALAEIYTMLENRLDPLIKDRIKVEINRRIFDSFFAGVEGTGKPFWWSTTCTNNWASVCMGSIGCTAMLMRPDLFDTLKPTLDRVMNNYLSGFGDDGYCLEGIHYWHYGFGFFTVYAEMLRRFTDGKEDYFKLAKVKEIATFMQKMFLNGKAAVSFADGTKSTEYHIGLVHFLKQEYPDAVKVYSPDYTYIEDGCGRFCLITRACTWVSQEIYDNPAKDTDPAEYYGENSKWYIKRTNSYGFAAKAGNNGEHHNHNDVGTFVFAKSGEQLFLDLGRGEYTKQYFRDDTRYQIIECRSKGHSLPYFGESGEQKFGEQYTSEKVEQRAGYLAMDMAKAYDIDGLESLHREYVADENSVTITDKFDYSGSDTITERFVCRYAPIVENGVAKIADATLEYDASLATVDVTEEMTTTNYKIYMLDFHLNPSVREFKVVIK